MNFIVKYKIQILIIIGLVGFLVILFLLLTKKKNKQSTSYLVQRSLQSNALYNVGVAKADITGSLAEVAMMGYADPKQVIDGLSSRLWARAYVIEDNNGKACCYVTTGLQGVHEGLHSRVIDLLSSYKNNRFNFQNVMLIAEHNHSGPGGYSCNVLYNFTSLGFSEDDYKVICNGIVKAIKAADTNKQAGCTIWFNRGKLEGAAINRSPTSYEANPEKEKSLYNSDLNLNMTVLRFDNSQNKPIGMLSWFATHGTSIKQTNKLAASDHKGYASYIFEKKYNFIGGFSQGAEGDVSPNMDGPWCNGPKGGKACDQKSSTCGGDPMKCIAWGPGGHHLYQSAQIVGIREFERADALMRTAKIQIMGSIDYRAQYVNMLDGVIVQKEYTGPQYPSLAETIQASPGAGPLCPPALGISFAAGTTDGPNNIGKQGLLKTLGPWGIAGTLLTEPSAAQRKCQSPKPIFLNVGEGNVAAAWVPTVIPCQILKIGQLVIAGAPGEFTTMSGRRLETVLRRNFPNAEIVIAGIANTYSGYVTTRSEYSKQRYEAASTLYGENTLGRYLQEFDTLSKSLINNTSINQGKSPVTNCNKQLVKVPGVVYDNVPLGWKFGQPIMSGDIVVGAKHDIDVNTKSNYPTGSTVQQSFWAAHPKNLIANGINKVDSIFYIEKYSGGKWETFRDDNDWDTNVVWKRYGTDASIMTVKWAIGNDVAAGCYRIKIQGVSKAPNQKLYNFYGFSDMFHVKTGGENCPPQDCEHNNQCKSGEGCCKKICTKLVKDWAGIPFCPSECRDAPPPLGKPGSCGSGYHWKRIKGEPCDTHVSCSGWVPSKPGTLACCEGKCTQ